jgi:hypothetical protein
MFDIKKIKKDMALLKEGKNKLFKNKDINSDKTLSVNLEDIKNPMDLVDALTKRNEYHNRKPVPMTEEDEYRNSGITKEEARKNG